MFPAGSQASPQDRFLVMAAEMDNSLSQELAQFWKEVQKAKIMEHRSVLLDTAMRVNLSNDEYIVPLPQCPHYSRDRELVGCVSP